MWGRTAVDEHRLRADLDVADGDTLLRRERIATELRDEVVLNFPDPRWSAGTSTDPATTALDALVGDLLAQRQEARARRDFATADGIRGRLTAAGVSVEDSPDGPTWTLKDH